MLNKARDMDYQRWQRERGTTYAEQQMRLKHLWSQHQTLNSSMDFAAISPAYSNMERYLGIKMPRTVAEHKAMIEQDLRDEERLILNEEAMGKHIEASRSAPDTFEGLCCVYGTIGTWSPKLLGHTRFVPGCFAKARASEIAYYFDHDPSYGPVADVLAVWEVTRKELPILTQLEYPEASGGLMCVRRFKDTENGRAAKSWITAGTVKGISVSVYGRRTSGRQIDGRMVIDILEADLDHISDGRYPGAIPGVIPVTGTKRYSLLQGQYKKRGI